VATKADITIIYHPRPDVTPEQARDARARAWRFVFDRWEQKKAAGKDGAEDDASEEYFKEERSRA
jgi:hypothetical protein